MLRLRSQLGHEPRTRDSDDQGPEYEEAQREREAAAPPAQPLPTPEQIGDESVVGSLRTYTAPSRTPRLPTTCHGVTMALS